MQAGPLIQKLLFSIFVLDPSYFVTEPFFLFILEQNNWRVPYVSYAKGPSFYEDTSYLIMPIII